MHKLSFLFSLELDRIRGRKSITFQTTQNNVAYECFCPWWAFNCIPKWQDQPKHANHLHIFSANLKSANKTWPDIFSTSRTSSYLFTCMQPLHIHTNDFEWILIYHNVFRWFIADQWKINVGNCGPYELGARRWTRRDGCISNGNSGEQQHAPWRLAARLL